MKAKIEPQQQEFNPVEMTITFESQQELEIMRMIMNKSGNDLSEYIYNSLPSSKYNGVDGSECVKFKSPIYDEVTKILNQLNNK